MKIMKKIRQNMKCRKENNSTIRIHHRLQHDRSFQFNGNSIASEPSYLNTDNKSGSAYSMLEFEQPSNTLMKKRTSRSHKKLEKILMKNGQNEKKSVNDQHLIYGLKPRHNYGTELKDAQDFKDFIAITERNTDTPYDLVTKTQNNELMLQQSKEQTEKKMFKKLQDNMFDSRNHKLSTFENSLVIHSANNDKSNQLPSPSIIFSHPKS